MSKSLRLNCVSILALTSAVALAVTACSPSGTQTSAASPPAADAGTSLALPLTTGPLVAASAAPPVQDLPMTAPVRIVRVSRPADRYAYADQAYAMNRALGQAPPDYGVDYENTHPWVWRSQTNAMQIVEPVSGGDRYYYFQPNAEDPYLIRDPQYAYAYADGALAAVYDRSGRALDPDAMSGMADWAGRYLSRARGLYRAAAQGARSRVIAANWAERRAVIASARADWEAQQRASSDWRAYHAEHDAEQQAYWRTEQDQRDRSAQAYEHWRRDDYRTPPPAVTAYGGDGRSASQGGAGRRTDRRIAAPATGPRRRPNRQLAATV